MKYIKILVTLAILLPASTITRASLVTITPDDCTIGSCWTTEQQSALKISEVESLIGESDLVLLYKSEQSDSEGSIDSGLFASSYDTTFLNSPTDPADALMEYIGGASIDCFACYLLIKDGDHSPAQYIFDLSDLSYLSIAGGWDGVMDLFLDGFWPDKGAISHIAIYGVVPLPAAFWLFGTALIGFVGISRRRSV